MAKLKQIGDDRVEFTCAICSYDGIPLTHVVSVKAHTWNGSLDKPTFSPSLLWDGAGMRCHSYVNDGVMTFCGDCTNGAVGGQTLEIPEWKEA